MGKFLLTRGLLLVAATAVLTTTADAADRSGRSNSRSSFNDYGTRSSQHTYYFPQNNQLVIEQRSGSSSYFYSSPIQQFGVPQTSYHNYGGNSYIIPPSRGVRPIW